MTIREQQLLGLIARLSHRLQRINADDDGDCYLNESCDAICEIENMLTEAEWAVARRYA